MNATRLHQSVLSLSYPRANQDPAFGARRGDATYLAPVQAAIAERAQLTGPRQLDGMAT